MTCVVKGSCQLNACNHSTWNKRHADKTCIVVTDACNVRLNLREMRVLSYLSLSFAGVSFMSFQQLRSCHREVARWKYTAAASVVPNGRRGCASSTRRAEAIVQTTEQSIAPRSWPRTWTWTLHAPPGKQAFRLTGIFTWCLEFWRIAHYSCYKRMPQHVLDADLL